MNKEKRRQYRENGYLLLYLCCVLYITLLSRGDSLTRIIKMDVFSSYHMWFAGNAAKGKSILQNIALFIPLGFLLTQALPSRKYRFPSAVLLGFVISLLIETAQYSTRWGWFDVDDLLNNTLGAAIGSGLFFVVERIAGKGKAGRMACDVLSVLLVAAGVVGCYQMKEMVGNSPEIVEHDFEKYGIPEPEVLDDGFFTRAELKAYSTKYDTYVFQKSDNLIWMIGYEIEPTTEIIYHIYTDEIGKLPENRIQFGFDNRGFRHGGENEQERKGRYRTFEKEIPTEYHVAYIIVGFNPGDGVVWSQAFRV